jgi:hypothetical protein
MDMGLSLEEKLAERINRSALGIKDKVPVNGPDQGVYVNNPYNAINPDRSTRFGKHPKGLEPDLVYGPDFLRPTLTRTQSYGLGLGDNPPSQADRINTYLDWGAAHARKQPFVGICETFNCVVIAILTAKNSPLDPGTVVEYIGVTQGSLGHAIAVIHRNHATEQIRQIVPAPQNWGDNCIVVDQWYALQAGCGPVFHVAGNHADKRYVTFLNEGTDRIDLRGRFTVSSDRPAVPLRN